MAAHTCLMPRMIAGAFIFLLAAGCATAPQTGGTFQIGPACDFGDVQFDGAVDTGRLNGCRQDGDRAYTLYVHPENTPVNPSSWYAFSIASDAPANLDLTLAYTHGRHRYDPQVSGDGGESWRTLDVSQSEDGTRAQFTLDVAAGETFVSAQPRFSLAEREAWLDRITAIQGVVRKRYGTSELGRPLEGFEFGTEGAPAVIVLGGQHPPEVRGAYALTDFIERLLADEPMANEFRARFHVVVAPVINPDGIAEGNWRHNSRGVDLNRDWGDFTQAETRSFVEWIDGRVQPIAFFDFHGTWKNVLYTSPDESKGDRNWFPGAFHAGLVKALGTDAPERAPSHDPRSAVAKNWFHETYAIPTMTYEVGDAVPMDLVHASGRLSAEITMRLLLQDAPVPTDPTPDGAQAE